MSVRMMSIRAASLSVLERDVRRAVGVWEPLQGMSSQRGHMIGAMPHQGSADKILSTLASCRR